MLLFKHFDAYQREHMLHHNANKLFTDDDEFTDFVVGICDLTTRLDRLGLWRRLVMLLISPVWHARFLEKRLRGSLRSQERLHNLVGGGFLLALFAVGLLTHTLGLIAVAWLLPLTVLLQVATVFRILCEHRLPPAEVIAARGPNLVCQATAGVFAGAIPPQEHLTKGAGAAGLGRLVGEHAELAGLRASVRAGGRCARAMISIIAAPANAGPTIPITGSWISKPAARAFR